MAGENTSVDTEVYADDFIGAWRAQAECLGAENPSFFPKEDNASTEELEEALGMCAVCVVKPECLEYALETNQLSGVWGGMEDDDRRRYRKRWLAVRRRNATDQ